MTAVRPTEDDMLRAELHHELTQLNHEARQMTRRGYTATASLTYAATHANINDVLDMLDMLDDATTSAPRLG